MVKECYFSVNEKMFCCNYDYLCSVLQTFRTSLIPNEYDDTSKLLNKSSLAFFCFECATLQHTVQHARICTHVYLNAHTCTCTHVHTLHITYARTNTLPRFLIYVHLRHAQLLNRNIFLVSFYTDVLEKDSGLSKFQFESMPKCARAMSGVFFAFNT